MRKHFVPAIAAAVFTFVATTGAVAQSTSDAAPKRHCSKEEMKKRKRAGDGKANSITPKPAAVMAGRVSFYSVGLVCKSAPKIGCGSKAKPVLLSLTSSPRISGAWLNEAGTRLAITWKDDGKALTLEQLDAVIESHGVALQTISNERDELLATFSNGSGWYDASEVGQLSEQEAGIIASRLVQRLSARAALSTEQSEQLRAALEQRFNERFSKNTPSSDIADELVEIAKPIVDETTLAAVREVVSLGYRPLPGEE